jgi:hypothetical protein
MKRLLLIPAAMAALAFGSISAFATSFTVSPWAYACGHTIFANPATATATCSESTTKGTSSASYAAGVLTLQKTGSTSEDLSAGATIGGLTTLTAASFDVGESYCGAGAPRLNVVTTDGDLHFFGCAANNNAGHVSFNLTAAGDGNAANDAHGGGVVGKGVTSINIVQDEVGTAVLSNLSFSGTAAVTATASPSPAASPRTTTPRLALTGGGPPLLPLGVGMGLVLLGASALALRRRPAA